MAPSIDLGRSVKQDNDNSMTDSFASGQNKLKPLSFQPKVIELAIPGIQPRRRRKSSLAIMETRENRFDSAASNEKEPTDPTNEILIAVHSFQQRIKRIDTRELEVPINENQRNKVVEINAPKGLEESVIIHRLKDTHSLTSPENNVGSEGTNRVSSKMVGSSYRGTGGTGGFQGGVTSHMSRGKWSPSPEGSISGTCDQIDFSSINEHALRALLNESIRDREYLENKMQRVDTRINSLQKSILEKSNTFSRAQHEAESTDAFNDQKTIQKSPMVNFNEKRLNKNSINRELVREVLAESQLIGIEDRAEQCEGAKTVIRGSIPRPNLQNYPRDNIRSPVKVTPAPASTKKRHLIIKSGREAPRLKNPLIPAGVNSRLTSGQKLLNQPDKGISQASRSFSINHRESRSRDQSSKPVKACRSIAGKSKYIIRSIHDSFILD